MKRLYMFISENKLLCSLGFLYFLIVYASSFIAGYGYGLVHIYRIIFPFEVVIEDYEVPTFASIVFLVLAIILCIGLWKESKAK